MKSADWRIGFQKNVPTLIGIGLIVALIGFFSGIIVMNVFPNDEIFPVERKQTFAQGIFFLGRIILYVGIAVIILGILLYIVIHAVNSIGDVSSEDSKVNG